MSFIQCKKAEYATHNEKKNQFKLTQNNTDFRIRILNNNDIKTVIITAFHMVKKLSRDMKNTKKIQIVLLEMKTTMLEIKIHWLGLTSDHA